MKPYLDEGYYRITLYNDQNEAFKKRRGRIICETFLKKPADNYTVDHIDKDTQHDHLSNLKWSSRSEQNKNRNIPEHPKGTKVNVIVLKKENDNKNSNSIEEVCNNRKWFLVRCNIRQSYENRLDLYLHGKRHLVGFSKCSDDCTSCTSSKSLKQCKLNKIWLKSRFKI